MTSAIITALSPAWLPVHLKGKCKVERRKCFQPRAMTRVSSTCVYVPQYGSCQKLSNRKYRKWIYIGIRSPPLIVCCWWHTKFHRSTQGKECQRYLHCLQCQRYALRFAAWNLFALRPKLFAQASLQSSGTNIGKGREQKQIEDVFWILNIMICWG